MSEVQNYDVVIIGGGPAGLTAGLYAGRSMLKTVMLEKMMPGGQVSITAELENYPGIVNITGPDIIIEMEKQVKKFGVETRSEEVESIEPGSGNSGHTIVTDSGTYLAKTIIITSGASAKHVGCEGEDSHIGRGVSYCATCDGAFFRDKEVVVIGGGDSAVEEATYLTKFASKVSVIHRRDQLRASKILQQRAFNNSKVNFIWDSVVEAIEGEPLVNNVKIKNVKTGEITDFKTDGVFVFIGFNPSNEFLPDAIKRDHSGFIITGENMETSVPGIFAAGDIRSKLLKQVVTACGDAATAAFAAEKYIEWNFDD
ncbi:MAG: thioredoxin-disulfide reductase [Candidatus Cloacimonadota bacterium]|nr:MAG: thioredoxin-disulfide reductase [Candidatus Cloacimonadota bacterium]PIE78820.1 MAG: thioredoxin-disulfide reductase [Candidatus Delongbacteria bacterium]